MRINMNRLRALGFQVDYNPKKEVLVIRPELATEELIDSLRDIAGQAALDERHTDLLIDYVHRLQVMQAIFQA